MTESKATTFCVSVPLEHVIPCELFKTLCEPIRCELGKVILKLGKADVSTIANQVSQDRSVVSRHLKQMHAVGLINCERDGRHTLYSMNAERLAERLEDIAQQIREDIKASL